MNTSRSLILAAVLAPSLLLGTGLAQAQLKAPAQAAKPGLKAATPAAAPAAAAAATPSPAPAATEAAAQTGEQAMEAAGQLAAGAWLTLLDRKDWGRAWDGSAGMFRSTVPLGAWMDGIPKVRDPLGALQERTPLDAVHKTELAGRPNGNYVTVSFSAKFANKEDAVEVVTTVLEPDGKWRVTGYQTQ